MKLEDIGFYTLSDSRAKNTNINSPLWRCELILTGLCNFKCPYCRGSRTDECMPVDKAIKTLDLWIKEGLKNVRFSGGEPTLYKHLKTLVYHCKENGVERIAISTNGSADISYYKDLIKLGVSDFSISLDACCSSYGDKMSGVEGMWEKVCYTIEEISKLSYVTVGCVFTNETVSELEKTISFATGLGVSDIRIISSAQNNITPKLNVPSSILRKKPILNYRVNNFNSGRDVRGIKKTDCHKCHLVKDDMAVEGDYHYPCIIHLRETKKPIGVVGKNMRKERMAWSESHDCYEDDICRKNCLDVCVDYNNKVRSFDEKNKSK